MYVSICMYAYLIYICIYMKFGIFWQATQFRALRRPPPALASSAGVFVGVGGCGCVWCVCVCVCVCVRACVCVCL